LRRQAKRIAKAKSGVVLAGYLVKAKISEEFQSLGPSLVLESFERYGLRSTGRTLFLNSFENRVVEIELEPSDNFKESAQTNLWQNHRVLKYYRPHRWSLEQILEEHEFILECLENEIPVAAPLQVDGKPAQLKNVQEHLRSLRANLSGKMQSQVETVTVSDHAEKSLSQSKTIGMWGPEKYFGLCPKVGGRHSEDLDSSQLRWLGRSMARLHGVGRLHDFEYRPEFNIDHWVGASAELLLEGGWVDPQVEERFEEACEYLYDKCLGIEDLPYQRIHGDAHRGNVLWNEVGPLWVDFDDCILGPVVQDIWLFQTTDDINNDPSLQEILEGYNQLGEFPADQLQWIALLRKLRQVYYAAWIARRYNDSAFQKSFAYIKEPRYWFDLVSDLES